MRENRPTSERKSTLLKKPMLKIIGNQNLEQVLELIILLEGRTEGLKGAKLNQSACSEANVQHLEIKGGVGIVPFPSTSVSLLWSSQRLCQEHFVVKPRHIVHLPVNVFKLHN